jgi:hypothetical protein
MRAGVTAEQDREQVSKEVAARSKPEEPPLPASRTPSPGEEAP